MQHLTVGCKPPGDCRCREGLSPDGAMKRAEGRLFRFIITASDIDCHAYDWRDYLLHTESVYLRYRVNRFTTKLTFLIF